MIHNVYVRGGQHVVPVAFSWGFCLLIAFLRSRQVISHHLTWPSPILYGKTWVKAGPSRHPGGDEKKSGFGRAHVLHQAISRAGKVQ